MNRNLFQNVASDKKNSEYEKHIQRENEIYKRKNDMRSEYERDYTRILHSLAYRRLKHKTQVFFDIGNDHICTRMEHVQHVESVSCTIAKFLGLNTELTRAIAVGHDLGHAPFGHEGEIELTAIRKEYGMDKFWHERNSLRIIDDIEFLEDNNGNYQSLNLTYAVRDGIISHCGEVDENGIKPRTEFINLNDFNFPNCYQPFTWEGCVVKISDKIAYLGRDIEDALRLDFINKRSLAKLRKIAGKYNESRINTTVIINDFIIDICENSSPDTGIRLSENYNHMLNEIKQFNYENIYFNPKFNVYKKYVSLVIRSIFDTFIKEYNGCETISKLKKLKKQYPDITENFIQYIYQHSDISDMPKYRNKKIYGRLESEKVYAQAIIDYISGMTDKYAIFVFNELISFK